MCLVLFILNAISINVGERDRSIDDRCVSRDSYAVSDPRGFEPGEAERVLNDDSA